MSVFESKAKSGLENERCAICGGSVDHDGYGEYEACHAFYCAEHEGQLSKYNGDLLCPSCKTAAMEAKREVA